MQPETISKLLKLNEQFYQTFARQFSQTRQRLQPGVQSLLPVLLAEPSLFDLGCGSGELARQLARAGFKGQYTGLDFSQQLLEIAGAGLPAGFNGAFIQANLAEQCWEERLPDKHCTALLAFAVLHHLPGASQRTVFLKRLHNLLPLGGQFIHSNWQFLRSERLRLRIQPWSRVGLLETDLQPGDFLLDWRSGGNGLRYVHHFSEPELAGLALASGFSVRKSFLSDGKSGDLSLYQVWEAVKPKKPTSG